MNAYRKDELRIEEHEIKELMDLASSLFDIRTAFIYAINDDEYISEIAGNNGDYQKYCQIIQKELKHKCIACDQDKFKEANNRKEPVLYRCYNGLYEMFLPLFLENNLVGHLHFGQVRGEEDFRFIARECSLYEHSQLNELKSIYNTMDIYSREKLILISRLFKKFSDIILKNKLIELGKTDPEYNLLKYIKDNIHKPINVYSAADHIGRSPSFVTHKFKQKYGKTFHQYLLWLRIENAKDLLKKYSIDKTSQLCGYKNRYHFSKVFKKNLGITPHEYQLLNRESER